MTNPWNFAAAVHRIGGSDLADRTALIHGDLSLSFADLRQRALGIATYLAAKGLPRGAHVGHYMRNSNAYLESFIGAGLAGLSHVNVNYRYREQELADLCQGLDIAVLIFDAEFADRVAAIHDQLPPDTVLIQVGGASDLADVSLEALYAAADPAFEPRASGDDLILIATGGTTGLPKGTQWRNEDMWRKLRVCYRGPLEVLQKQGHPTDMGQHLANVASVGADKPFLSLSPLMHGAGLMMALAVIGQGGAVMTLPGKRFDAEVALDAIHDRGVGSLVLVGDAFGLPLAEAISARGGDAGLASLDVVISSGASLGDASRDALLGARPDLVIMDTLGSSEASGYGLSTPEPGVFLPLPTTRVLDDAFRAVEPGSDTIGMAYAGGNQPIGYYQEPEKSAETFVTIAGERYVRTGDRCRVRADGMLVLLGRDSTVINTGGEKVYTVEVEVAITTFPSISDALVIAMPHPRFGKQVVAVVEGPGLTVDTLDTNALLNHLSGLLADYKIPRHVLVIESLQRAPNGKPDYAFVTAFAESQLA
ncbi:MAG: AMP-binding protein [Pseudomonadota bacterium]